MANLIATSNSVASFLHHACLIAELKNEVMDSEDEYHSWEANGCVCLSDFSDDEFDDWDSMGVVESHVDTVFHPTYVGPDVCTFTYQALERAGDHCSHVVEVMWGEIPF